MFLLTAPFLFSQVNFVLSLKGPEQGGNQAYDKIALLTSYTRKIAWTDSLGQDSTLKVLIPKKEAPKKFHMKKSPLKAVLLSAVLPGAGQFYNESYWKIPIIAGLVGYFGYEYIRQNNLYKDYRDDYTVSQTPENPAGDLNLKTLREFYRNQRDDFVWYFLIIYTVNLVDAYVGAQLFDFDVREEKGGGQKTYRLKLNLDF